MSVTSELDQVLTAATEARGRLDDAIAALEEHRASVAAQAEAFRRQRENQDRELVNLRQQVAQLRDVNRDNA